MSLGVVEILIILLVFLALGPRRITDLVRSLGRGVHDFVEALGRDRKNELPEEEQDADQKPHQ